jgi:hypothetical protein
VKKGDGMTLALGTDLVELPRIVAALETLDTLGTG